MCLHEDNCCSVHIDGRAYVFGVIGDVIAFEEGEPTTPDEGQISKKKGMSFCCMI